MTSSAPVRRAAGVLVALLVALGGVEILIRVTGQRVEPSFGTILELSRTQEDNTRRNGAPAVFKLWAPDDALGWRFRPNATVDLSYVRYYENKIARTNSAGMLDAEPDPQKKLVFVMGDSFVEGLPVNYEQHFCRRLERAFPSYDFLNFGVSGYGSVQSYLHLKERLGGRAPSQVLFAVYFGNDFDENDPFLNNSMTVLPGYRRDAIPFLGDDDQIVYGSAARPAMSGLFERSQVWLVARRAARNAGLITPTGYGVALRILQRLSGELRASGIPLTVLLIPDDAMIGASTAPLHDALMKDLAAARIDTISLLAPFRAAGLPTMGFRDQSGKTIDPHWSGAGHSIAARAIAEALQSRLPDAGGGAALLDEEANQASIMKAGLEALYTRSDAAAAAVEFRKVLERNPTHYGATYQLATALDRAGKGAEARPLWEAVVGMAEKYNDQATLATARARLAQKP